MDGQQKGSLLDRDGGILVFRVSMGTLMILHGLMKIGGGWEFIETLGGMPPLVPDNTVVQLVLGSLATSFEILGGLGLLSGYRFRTACILLIMVMVPAFVYDLVGRVDGFRSFMTATWPLELASVFTAFIFIGPGKHVLRKSKVAN